MKTRYLCNYLPLILALLILATDCVGAHPYPACDPGNQGKWVLNTDISDEFESSDLDQNKWLIQGMGGEYKSNWIGRAPSQFSTDNVRLEDGKLKLQSRWEPEFDFSEKRDFSWKEHPEGTAYENITTAAVISKKQFLHGYMEIKCKAADASVTSAFWMTGQGAELDVFEFSGRPSQTKKKHLESELWSSIHDWSKPGGPTTWTDRLQLPWRVAGGFHVYGVEWNENELKFHADGKLVRTVNRQDVGDEGWAIKTPLCVWVDSETFPWHGVPSKEDLPVDYEIEYIRIWQTEEAIAKQKLLTDLAEKSGGLMGFEGPMEIGGKQANWWIDQDSSKHFSIVNDKPASGRKSLKFTHKGALAKTAVAFAPNGSFDLAPGKYEFSMKVWLAPKNSLKSIRIIFDEPWLQLKPISLSKVETGKWVTLSQTFHRSEKSGVKDRPRILVEPEDVPGGTSTMYIDDLSIKKH